MSAAQVSRDLRFVATDLGCALLQVSVSGVAAVGSWVGRRRQVVLSDRAQAVLDADRLAEAEEAVECLEPGWDRQPQCQAGHRYYDSFVCTKPFGHDGDHGYAGSFWPEAHATDPDPMDGGRWCYAHNSWFRDCRSKPTVCRMSREPFEMAPVHPADAKHHGGHQLHLDGSLTSLPVRSLAGMAGDGPEDVTASSGQPTGASELLDHVETLINEHTLHLFNWLCAAEGCDWRGYDKQGHTRHVAELVIAMVTADTRINNALNRNQR